MHENKSKIYQSKILPADNLKDLIKNKFEIGKISQDLINFEEKALINSPDMDRILFII